MFSTNNGSYTFYDVRTSVSVRELLKHVFFLLNIINCLEVLLKWVCKISKILTKCCIFVWFQIECLVTLLIHPN